MIRTRIYLTPQENRNLGMLARLEGRPKSEIIRNILDERLGPGAPRVAAAAARRYLGSWKGKGDKNFLGRLRSRWTLNRSDFKGIPRLKLFS